MNDKVERMAATIMLQQQKIETLTERVVRLETALEMGLEMGLAHAAENRPPRRISHQE
jgi:hypothetical protein